MKIKLKKGVILPNNWKASGNSKDDWQTLNGGGVLEVASIPSSIKDNVDVIEASSKPKNKGGK